jgi:5-methylcytosine-specific restriction endonuclease McrA
MDTCTKCDRPRKPYPPSRPGKFFTLCDEHQAEYTRKKALEYYYRHHDECKQRMRKWRMDNPEIYKASKKRSELLPKAIESRQNHYKVSGRTWYIAHKDEVIAYSNKWRKANPEQDLANKRRAKHRRRALNSKGTYTETQLQARINFYGRRCYLCGCDWNALPTKTNVSSGEFWKTIDHVIPLSRGGSNWPANLRPACSDCNLSKWANPLSTNNCVGSL